MSVPSLPRPPTAGARTTAEHPPDRSEIDRDPTPIRPSSIRHNWVRIDTRRAA